MRAVSSHVRRHVIRHLRRGVCRDTGRVNGLKLHKKLNNFNDPLYRPSYPTKVLKLCRKSCSRMLNSSARIRSYSNVDSRLG